MTRPCQPRARKNAVNCVEVAFYVQPTANCLIKRQARSRLTRPRLF